MSHIMVIERAMLPPYVNRNTSGERENKCGAELNLMIFIKLSNIHHAGKIHPNDIKTENASLNILNLLPD